MIVVLAISALLFLGTVGYLIKNAAGIAELFAKRPVEAEPGDLIDGPVRARRASRAAIVTALALHVLGLVGLVVAALVAVGALVFFSFGRIDRLVTQQASTEVSSVLANAALGRELSLVLARLNQLGLACRNERAPADLLRLTGGQLADIAR